jgi:hypothetical protein
LEQAAFGPELDGGAPEAAVDVVHRAVHERRLVAGQVDAACAMSSRVPALLPLWSEVAVVGARPYGALGNRPERAWAARFRDARS